MDQSLEKQLEEVLRRSRELVRQSQGLTARTAELMEQTEMLFEQVRSAKGNEGDKKRKKLGST
jgi:hypothetical protein